MRSSVEFVGSSDVCVVGGGVAGLAAARALARRGLAVTVVEHSRPGAGASGAAGGMLAPQAEAEERDEFFDLLCASRDMYPAFAEALRDETGIDIELDQTGTLYVALGAEDEEDIERRFAWQRRAGLEVEWLAPDEALALEPAVSPRVRAALRFPRDWQVENRQLVRALAASCLRLGVRIMARTEARGVRAASGRVAGVETSKGFLGAGAVVLAAGASVSRVPVLAAAETTSESHPRPHAHPLIEPVRGQMLCFEHAPTEMAPIRHVVYSPRGYLVPRRDGRLLTGSTTEQAGFDCAVTAAGLHTITEHAIELAPAVAHLRLTDTWAGLRPRAADGWPVIGESPEVKGLYYAAGYYRNGILLAPAAGDALADLVTEGRSGILPDAFALFSPARLGRVLVGTHEQ
jgi:glycine oxidase